jgi:hypothetical protein
MFHRRLLIVVLFAAGIAFATQDAAARPKLRRHRCDCRCQPQAVEAPAEVEQVLQKLRPHFPGKTDDQIIRVLRGYVTHEDSKEKDGMRWFAERLEQARKQKEAVKGIMSVAGASVDYDWQVVPLDDRAGPDEWLQKPPNTQPPEPEWLRNLLGQDFFAEVIGVYFNNTKATNADLKHLDGLPHVARIFCQDTAISDAGLEHLEGLRHLRAAYLTGMPITDAGLAHLEGLTNLRLLWLFGTKITDEGLAHLKGLHGLQSLWLADDSIKGTGLIHLAGLAKLQDLDLQGTQVSGPGLESLKSLPQLAYLNLVGTSIQDDGLAYLKELTQLQRVDLLATAVTAEAGKKLEHALPNCQFRYPGGPASFRDPRGN